MAWRQREGCRAWEWSWQAQCLQVFHTKDTCLLVWDVRSLSHVRFVAHGLCYQLQICSKFSVMDILPLLKHHIWHLIIMGSWLFPLNILSSRTMPVPQSVPGATHSTWYIVGTWCHRMVLVRFINIHQITSRCPSLHPGILGEPLGLAEWGPEPHRKVPGVT